MIRTRSVAAVVRVLRVGGAAVIPTDTAYALAVDASNRAAVARVRQLKGRDARKPIAVIAADLAQVRRFFQVSKPALRLARRFWPGPLTIVLRPKARLAASNLARGGIGVRVPANATARDIARTLGAPITATSANRSGGVAPYTTVAVSRQFRRARPDILFAAGMLPVRPVSTVVRLRGNRVHILRSGAVPSTQLHVLR